MSARTVAFVQARMGSTRLPGKVLMPMLGRPMLAHIVDRLRTVPALDAVVVATSESEGDEPIRAFCREQGVASFAGSENDVLDRFHRAADAERADRIVRVTGDCPLVDPGLVGRLLELYDTGQFDHAALATGAGAIYLEGGRFPDGLDAECFSREALGRAWREATDPADREHVTPYIWRNKELFRCGHLQADADYSTLRWTVDNREDFDLVSRIYDALSPNGRPFGWRDVLGFLADHPELAAVNRGFIGREGYKDLWRPARS